MSERERERKRIGEGHDEKEEPYRKEKVCFPKSRSSYQWMSG